MNGALETLLRWKDYSSRSTRTEFWMYVFWSYIALFLGFLVYSLIMYVTGAVAGGLIHIIFATMFFLLMLVVSVAHIAVAVRRLHDIGFSGWWILLSFIPIVNLTLLIFFLINSQPGTNRFGPNPKFDDELAAAFS